MADGILLKMTSSIYSGSHKRSAIIAVVFLLLAVSSGCSSAQKRAQEALEKGDYFAAAQGFEAVLAKEPDNGEARAGLTAARSKILDTRLIDIRKARESGNPGQAADQLLEVIGWEVGWKQLPRGAAVFTQEEETGYARGFALKELKQGVEAAKAFAAELVFRKYSPFFKEAKMGEFSALQARNRQNGIAQCKAFAQDDYTGLPYGAIVARRVCAYWGENPQFKGEDPAAVNSGLIREFKIEGSIQGLPPEIATQLSLKLNQALQASPWFSASGTGSPVISLSGEYKMNQSRTAIQLVHSYTEPQEYVDSDLVTKSRDVPYETIENSYNPATGKYEAHNVIRHRMETYQESVPVKKTRYVNKTYPYGAWKIHQLLQVGMRATGSLGGRALEIAVADHSDSEDSINETEIPSIGLKRKLAILPDQYMWLKNKSEKLASDFRAKLDSSWRELYCADAPSGAFSRAANQAWRCLRLGSATANPPAPIDEWHRRTLGVSVGELTSLLR